MSPGTPFNSVPAYLAALDARQQEVLESVLAAVTETVPAATRVISYGIPAFRLDKVFMYCAAFKHHIGVYPPVRNDPKLSKALERYANPKGNLRFALDEPMPMPLIRRVAKALAQQDAASAVARVRNGPKVLKVRKKTASRRAAARASGRQPSNHLR